MYAPRSTGSVRAYDLRTGLLGTQCICLWEEAARNARGGGEGKGEGGHCFFTGLWIGKGGGYIEPPSQAVFCV